MLWGNLCCFLTGPLGGDYETLPLENPNCGPGSNVRIFLFKLFYLFSISKQIHWSHLWIKPTTQVCLSNVSIVIIWVKFGQKQLFNIGVCNNLYLYILIRTRSKWTYFSSVYCFLKISTFINNYPGNPY